MNTSSRTDWALLRRYVDERSQEAFAALVARHLDMVYTTCLREIGNVVMAEDAAQAVFISLAVKAPRLSARTHIAGWLFQAARFAARTVRTRETRRQRYESEAARMNSTDSAAPSDPWTEIEPLLTDAVARLASIDREAILLRYFDGLRVAEVAASLGISEQAARKRVTRAVERLRRLLARRGVAELGAASLAALLPVHAAKAAPLALAPLVARYAKVGAGAKSVSLGLLPSTLSQLSQGTLNAMRYAQFKTAAGIAAAACVIGGAAFGAAHVKPKPSAPAAPPNAAGSQPMPSPTGFETRRGASVAIATWNSLPKFEQAKLTASDDHAKRLGLAMLQYQQDNKNTLPPMTSTFAARQALQPYMFGAVSPLENQKDRKAFADNSFRFNSRVSYVNYALMTNPAHTIAFYSAAPDLFGYRVVAFADFHVEIVDPTEWTAIQTELEPS